MSHTAIVILTWNGEEMLRRYLPSVIRHSEAEADIYVADNDSHDGTLSMLANEFPQCRVIALDRNYGFAEGYNRALAQIEADYYVLLNSDVEVTEHWLTPLIAFMDHHPEVAACQPKLRSVAEPDKFEYAGACGGYLDRYGYPFCRGRLFDCVEHDHGQYDTPAEVLWATGAALFVRAREYKEVGGLDGRFFAHQEEIDMCWRLRILGRKIYCLPQSVVYHVGGGTLPKTNSKKTFLNFRNNLTMLYKNLPQRELRRVMFVRWLLDYVAAWQTLLFHRNVADFKAIYQARRAYRRWRSDFDADRHRIQKLRQSDQIPEHRNYSLLWLYYAKGLHRFSLLP